MSGGKINRPISAIGLSLEAIVLLVIDIRSWNFVVQNIPPGPVLGLRFEGGYQDKTTVLEPNIIRSYEAYCQGLNFIALICLTSIALTALFTFLAIRSWRQQNLRPSELGRKSEKAIPYTFLYPLLFCISGAIWFGSLTLYKLDGHGWVETKQKYCALHAKR